MLVIDDFGAGYSSLANLQRLPIDRLKIAPMFIREIDRHEGQSRRARALVRTVIGLANSLDIEAVAEGVETDEQYAYLREAGCHRAQGYLFDRPMPAIAAKSRLEPLRANGGAPAH
jgi:EAL domain-containing protein (putative c-di-GMP-specific phosphodiesterase class I)